MNQEQIASLYRQVSARGASKVGLVVKLYDAILEDFRRALEAVASGEIERRTNTLNHALQVIAELQNSLDHERGGDVARRLENFYNVTRTMIVAANIRPSREGLQELIDLYAPVRQAWQQAESDVSRGPSNSADSGEHASQRVGVGADADEPHSHWSA
jgi:flagellar secretion chaperone FliS